MTHAVRSHAVGYVSPPFVDYFVGLDLGRVSDFTALAVLERTAVSPGAYRYDVTALQRSQRGSLYPQIVEATRKTVGDPALRPRREYPQSADGPARLEWAPLPSLVVDATGAGA